MSDLRCVNIARIANNRIGRAGHVQHRDRPQPRPAHTGVECLPDRCRQPASALLPRRARWRNRRSARGKARPPSTTSGRTYLNRVHAVVSQCTEVDDTFPVRFLAIPRHAIPRDLCTGFVRRVVSAAEFLVAEADFERPQHEREQSSKSLKVNAVACGVLLAGRKWPVCAIQHRKVGLCAPFPCAKANGRWAPSHEARQLWRAWQSGLRRSEPSGVRGVINGCA